MLKTARVQAKYFHAKMDEADKAYVQDAFLEGRLKVIVATTAFGMGVDKPDVRWVINDGAPSSLEENYQEAGRAGRDGKPASCYVIWDLTNSIGKDSASRNPAGSALDNQQERSQAKDAALDRCQAMERYCTTHGCLRVHMLRYFGEEPSQRRCGSCDFCTGSSRLAGVAHTRNSTPAVFGRTSAFHVEQSEENTPSTPILCNPCCISSKPCTVIKAPGTALSKSSMHCMGRGAYRLWEVAESD